MNFTQSLDYLYGLGHEISAMKFGLENTEKLLSILGNPHQSFPKIQIVGTNGKGSTCAFLEAICRANAIKTGVLTSPHLVSITERIKVNGVEISEHDFARHCLIVREICEQHEISATFFEQITAIALSYFAENRVELAILETGLGGRLDSVTATNAELIGFTPISLDHQEHLGNSINEIAAEKVAVVRFTTQKVFTAKQSAEVEKIISERCKKFGISPKSVTDFKHFHAGKISLKGKHQIENANLAALIAGNLDKFGFAVSRENISEGLQTAQHKGRLEFRDGILFDGAHNIEGAKALRDYLQEFHREQKITLIFGAMRDKDLSEIAAILFPLAENLILTEAENPRSAKVTDLAKFAVKYLENTKIRQIENVAEAIKKAREISDGNNLICLTGSLYLIGEAFAATR